ncbi:CDP-alcohol phosphatidyltransferase family protein [Desulfopila aestuarii]|uniref:Phosphatidylglycerophosphate synthase n=1 Tax=Desulfopila aestuarii DSM 18488 TaxID=1121416 RepID=A0A1M7Y8Q9_9BACT|nr:CDP-alcohol phosphatidyltransferase family protein [Desulfopila aestuarii]SHO49024.1 Phosphatidylglycerophosphate synthase [Desulfopila aestuarii DSM 18488]
MLDRFAIEWLRGPLVSGARWLHAHGMRANQVTLWGFMIGMLAIPAIGLNWYSVGLLLILMNRVADGIDGALARIDGATDAGGFLDIVLDFIFYSGIIFAFALADPARNSLAATALIFSFVGTGSSFLAYAIMAERRKFVNIVYPHKGFYYLGGLAEGTETIFFFIAICLFPALFPLLAWFFAGICLLTTIVRVWGGYRAIAAAEEERR